ncbi:MAG TPA: putative quinol monooxygenase [Candidatus Binataceae bacterium]|nr:putative quinol monooxygenase [Candidatus Binataceae bacterium]
MAITVIAKLKAKAGSEAQLEAAFRKMIGLVRTEPGTLSYVLHRSTQDPTTFVFYETYQDQAALDFHGKTPHMKEMGGAIGGLLDGRPQIDILTELDRK